MTAEPVFSPGRFRGWQHVTGVDVETLATAAGVSVAHVRACAYEHPVVDTPTQEMIKTWAALLGCSPDELRSTTPDEPAEYWRGVSRAMGPMRPEDIQGVVDVFDRTVRRQVANIRH